MGNIKDVHLKRYEENIKHIKFEIESLTYYIEQKKKEIKMWENAKNKR
jgi:predicted RNase H-like nuclease (RuvC/YqgF family)